jgi:hypothetical protein
METPGVDDVERTQLAQSPFGLGADPFPDLGAPAPPAAQRRPTGQMPAVGAPTISSSGTWPSTATAQGRSRDRSWSTG